MSRLKLQAYKAARRCGHSHKKICGIDGKFIKIASRHSFQILDTELISAFSIFLCVKEQQLIKEQ